LKKITEQLSSLHYTTWTLIVLFLWFSWGIVLASSEHFSNGFRLMNTTLVRHWLATPDNGFFLLKFWFVGLCVVVAFLGINLVFCSWNKFLRFIRIRFNGPKFIMLVVHILFGLIALGHFGGGYARVPVRRHSTSGGPIVPVSGRPRSEGYENLFYGCSFYSQEIKKKINQG